MQEVIQAASVARASGKPIPADELVMRVVDAAAAGALTGGGMGTATAALTEPRGGPKKPKIKLPDLSAGAAPEEVSVQPFQAEQIWAFPQRGSAAAAAAPEWDAARPAVLSMRANAEARFGPGPNTTFGGLKATDAFNRQFNRNVIAAAAEAGVTPESLPKDALIKAAALAYKQVGEQWNVHSTMNLPPVGAGPDATRQLNYRAEATRRANELMVGKEVELDFEGGARAGTIVRVEMDPTMRAEGIRVLVADEQTGKLVALKFHNVQELAQVMKFGKPAPAGAVAGELTTSRMVPVEKGPEAPGREGQALAEAALSGERVPAAPAQLPEHVQSLEDPETAWSAGKMAADRLAGAARALYDPGAATPTEAAAAATEVENLRRSFGIEITPAELKQMRRESGHPSRGNVVKNARRLEKFKAALHRRVLNGLERRIRELGRLQGEREKAAAAEAARPKPAPRPTAPPAAPAPVRATTPPAGARPATTPSTAGTTAPVAPAAGKKPVTTYPSQSRGGEIPISGMKDDHLRNAEAKTPAGPLKEALREELKKRNIAPKPGPNDEGEAGQGAVSRPTPGPVGPQEGASQPPAAGGAAPRGRPPLGGKREAHPPRSTGEGTRILSADLMPEIQPQHNLTEEELGRIHAGLDAAAEAAKAPVKIRMMVHQLENVARTLQAWATGNAMLIADGTGMGKTLSGIAVLRAAVDRLGARGLLVIVPNRTIEAQWEATAATMGFKVVRVSGKTKHSADPGTIHIVTYKTVLNRSSVGAGDAVRQVPIDEVIADLGFTPDVTIADEAHYLAGWSPSTKFSEQSTSASGMALLKASKRQLFMTATPMQTALNFAYLAEFMPGAYNSFGAMLAELGIKMNTDKKAWEGLSPDKLLKLHDRLVSAGVYTKAELEVEKVKNRWQELIRMYAAPLFAPITAATAKKYNLAQIVVRAALDKLDEVEGNFSDNTRILLAQKISLLRAIVEESRVDFAIKLAERKMAEGFAPVFFVERLEGGDFDVKQSDSPAVKMLWRDLATAGIKTESPVELLRKRLEARGISFVEISGNAPAGSALRENGIRAFQSGDAQAAVVTIAAGGTGLSLHDMRGDHPRFAIFIQTPFSAQAATQALGRIFRLGSQSDAQTVVLASNTNVDKKYVLALMRRLRTMGTIVKGAAADVGESHTPVEFEFNKDMPPTLEADRGASDEDIEGVMQQVLFDRDKAIARMRAPEPSAAEVVEEPAPNLEVLRSEPGFAGKSVTLVRVSDGKFIVGVNAPGEGSFGGTAYATQSEASAAFDRLLAAEREKKSGWDAEQAAERERIAAAHRAQEPAAPAPKTPKPPKPPKAPTKNSRGTSVPYGERSSPTRAPGELKENANAIGKFDTYLVRSDGTNKELGSKYTNLRWEIIDTETGENVTPKSLGGASINQVREYVLWLAGIGEAPIYMVEGDPKINDDGTATVARLAWEDLRDFQRYRFETIGHVTEALRTGKGWIKDKNAKHTGRETEKLKAQLEEMTAAYPEGYAEAERRFGKAAAEQMRREAEAQPARDDAMLQYAPPPGSKPHKYPQGTAFVWKSGGTGKLYHSPYHLEVNGEPRYQLVPDPDADKSYGGSHNDESEVDDDIKHGEIRLLKPGEKSEAGRASVADNLSKEGLEWARTELPFRGPQLALSGQIGRMHAFLDAGVMNQVQLDGLVAHVDELTATKRGSEFMAALEGLRKKAEDLIAWDDGGQKPEWYTGDGEISDDVPGPTPTEKNGWGQRPAPAAAKPALSQESMPGMPAPEMPAAPIESSGREAGAVAAMGGEAKSFQQWFEQLLSERMSPAQAMAEATRLSGQKPPADFDVEKEARLAAKRASEAAGQQDMFGNQPMLGSEGRVGIAGVPVGAMADVEQRPDLISSDVGGAGVSEATVAPSEIRTHPRFQNRDTKGTADETGGEPKSLEELIDQANVQTLLDAEGGYSPDQMRMNPPLVWRDVAGELGPAGQLWLLSGHHRLYLASNKFAKNPDTGRWAVTGPRGEPIHVKITGGSLEYATKLAVLSNRSGIGNTYSELARLAFQGRERGESNEAIAKSLRLKTSTEVDRMVSFFHVDADLRAHFFPPGAETVTMDPKFGATIGAFVARWPKVFTKLVQEQFLRNVIKQNLGLAELESSIKAWKADVVDKLPQERVDELLGAGTAGIMPSEWAHAAGALTQHLDLTTQKAHEVMVGIIKQYLPEELIPAKMTRAAVLKLIQEQKHNLPHAAQSVLRDINNKMNKLADVRAEVQKRTAPLLQDAMDGKNVGDQIADIAKYIWEQLGVVANRAPMGGGFGALDPVLGWFVDRAEEFAKQARDAFARRVGRKARTINIQAQHTGERLAKSAITEAAGNDPASEMDVYRFGATAPGAIMGDFIVMPGVLRGYFMEMRAAEGHGAQMFEEELFAVLGPEFIKDVKQFYPAAVTAMEAMQSLDEPADRSSDAWKDWSRSNTPAAQLFKKKWGPSLRAARDHYNRVRQMVVDVSNEVGVKPPNFVENYMSHIIDGSIEWGIDHIADFFHDRQLGVEERKEVNRRFANQREGDQNYVRDFWVSALAYQRWAAAYIARVRFLGYVKQLLSSEWGKADPQRAVQVKESARRWCFPSEGEFSKFTNDHARQIMFASLGGGVGQIKPDDAAAFSGLSEAQISTVLFDVNGKDKPADRFVLVAKGAKVRFTRPKLWRAVGPTTQFGGQVYAGAAGHAYGIGETKLVPALEKAFDWSLELRMRMWKLTGRKVSEEATIAEMLRMRHKIATMSFKPGTALVSWMSRRLSLALVGLSSATTIVNLTGILTHVYTNYGLRAAIGGLRRSGPVLVRKAIRTAADYLYRHGRLPEDIYKRMLAAAPYTREELIIEAGELKQGFAATLDQYLERLEKGHQELDVKVSRFLGNWMLGAEALIRGYSAMCAIDKAERYGLGWDGVQQEVAATLENRNAMIRALRATNQKVGSVLTYVAFEEYFTNFYYDRAGQFSGMSDAWYKMFLGMFSTFPWSTLVHREVAGVRSVMTVTAAAFNAATGRTPKPREMHAAHGQRKYLAPRMGAAEPYGEPGGVSGFLRKGGATHFDRENAAKFMRIMFVTGALASASAALGMNFLNAYAPFTALILVGMLRALFPDNDELRKTFRRLESGMVFRSGHGMLMGGPVLNAYAQKTRGDSWGQVAKGFVGFNEETAMKIAITSAYRPLRGFLEMNPDLMMHQNTIWMYDVLGIKSVYWGLTAQQRAQHALGWPDLDPEVLEAHRYPVHSKGSSKTSTSMTPSMMMGR